MKNSETKMANSYFIFKEFTINQDKAVFKVGTDGVLLGACSDLSGASGILDIGTGTGLIAIMTAQRSNATIIAIEPEVNSFQQACENVQECKWRNRIKVLNNNFTEYASATNLKFDIILSNPPYFRNSLKNPDIDKSAARHSDSLSEAEILDGALKLLNPEGSLQLILPYTEGTMFIAGASDYGFFCNRIIKIKPTPSGEIKRLILKFERTKKQIQERFLTIETGTRHLYTEDYKDITRNFYLKF
jgi:tRNA1Val (adenine37-N6)-methyltransferase